MLDLYCLNKSCVHERTQSYLTHGKLGKEIDRDANRGHTCPICNGEWDKSFLPILKKGTLHFLKDAEELPCKAMYDNLINLIWKNEHWIEKIYNRKLQGVTKAKLEELCLQLIARKLIGIVKRNQVLTWSILRERNSKMTYPPHRYEDDKNWDEISLLPTQTANII